MITAKNGLLRRFLLLAMTVALTSASSNALALLDDDVPQKPAVTDLDKQSVIESGNMFAAGLYNQLRAGSGNMFIAPQSVYQVLGMLCAGARGAMAGEMSSALYHRMDSTRIFGATAQLLAEKTQQDGFLSANMLWVQKDFPLKAEFLDQVKTSYGAAPQSVDFTLDANGAVQAINSWAEEKTSGRIHDLVTRDIVPQDARLVLTNAVYFKADWKDAFDKSATIKDAFHLNIAQEVPVSMMSRLCKESCAYYEDENYQAVSIPYKGDAVEMVVFLPRSITGLAALEEKMRPTTLEEMLQKLEGGKKVNLRLPRFHIESSYNLSDPLSAMGFASLFDSAKADFSGMTGKRDLVVSAVVRKPLSMWMNKGTEAAAATAAVMSLTSAAVTDVPAEFHADHPFFVSVARDVKTNAVYFMGRVVNPSWVLASLPITG